MRCSEFSDNNSRLNREYLVKYLVNKNAFRVSDMGGGLGTLMLMIKQGSSESDCILYEPYAGLETMEYLASHGIVTSKDIPLECDAYIFMDVLEHLESPLEFVRSVISSARHGSLFVLEIVFILVLSVI